MARTLVEPVLGTSTKMHLCLWEITAIRLAYYSSEVLDCDITPTIPDSNAPLLGRLGRPGLEPGTNALKGRCSTD